MRTIKFRAWDKENKKMYSPALAAFKGELFELFIGFGGSLCSHEIDKDGMVIMRHQPDRFELMQFTGLLDKNGKEVYEGDIITFRYGLKPVRTTILAEIIFAPDYAAFLRKPIYEDHERVNRFGKATWKRKLAEKVPSGDRHYCIDDDWLCESHCYEVMGNIYENSDLLLFQET